MKRNIYLWGSIIIILLVAAFAELMAYLTSSFLITYPVGFTPLRITEEYENYSGRYDPRVGWKSNVLDDEGNYRNTDLTGAASLSNGRITGRACISLYGDSFVEGYGVKPEHSWGTLLSRLINCRVANFGVSGYGTDQASLTFLDNPKDQADLVILGFLSENIMRNVNQCRNLISDVPSCHLKPRFIVDKEGQLTLVPLPQLTKEEYATLTKNPERILQHEFFLPGGPSGYRSMAFPYTWGIFQVRSLIFKNVVLRRGTYYDLYRPDHPSRALAVTQAIIEDFCALARTRGKQPVILVIPTHIDLANYRRHGTWVYQPLIDHLVRKNLDFIDVGPEFIHYLGESPLETLYSPKTMYHLNENGNAVLAKIVFTWLKQKGLLPPGKGRNEGQGSWGPGQVFFLGETGKDLLFSDASGRRRCITP